MRIAVSDNDRNEKTHPFNLLLSTVDDHGPAPTKEGHVGEFLFPCLYKKHYTDRRGK